MLDEKAKQGGQSNPPPIQFLRDDASDDDFFGSHQRVANALASAVEDNPNLKVVGLLGAWGSGKSTVVQLLSKRLEKSQKAYPLFTYDAWLHQSDPPRRAFLERFLDFLDRQGLVEKDNWSEQMGRLNRRIEDSTTTTTPTLTRAGHLLLLSLVLVPFGTRFLGADWFKRMIETGWLDFEHWVFPIGLIFAAAPLLLVFCLYYSWRPHRWPFSKAYFKGANWTTHRAGHGEESLLALIVNKQVQTQKNRIVKTPEPSTIEFQETFRDMLAAAARNDQHIIIVIDNLDRLPDDEAISMWTTIRSLFLGALSPAEQPGAAAMPTVVLPIDVGAVNRIYSKDANGAGKTSADSFMDKTFDIVFHVNLPVLSGWHSYFADKMKVVLGGEVASAWSFEVGRMYEKNLKGLVTPRDLNRMVNSIATLWQQWRPDGLPFPTIAYYAVMRNELEQDLMEGIRNPAIDLAEHDPDWQKNLAAIHYGVPPNDAIQILIGPQLTDAIQSNDQKAFDDQAKIKGFERVLYNRFAPAELEPAQVFNLCRLMHGANLETAAWVTVTWNRLRAEYSSWRFGPEIGSHASVMIEILAAHVEKDQRAAFLATIARKMAIGGAKPAEVRQPPSGYIALLKSWLALARLQEEGAGHVQIDDPGLYLTSAGIGLQNGKLDPLIQTAATGEALAGHLQSQIADSKPPADPLQQTMVFLNHEVSEKRLSELLDAVKDHITNNDARFRGMEAAVHLIGASYPKLKVARDLVETMANNDVLRNRITEAFANDRIRLAARLCALGILSGLVLPSPGGQNWESFLRAKPAFLDDLDGDIRSYAHQAYLHMIPKLAENDGATVPLAKALIERLLAARNMGNLYVADVVGDVFRYSNLVDEGRRSALAAQLSYYQKFWESMKGHEFNASVIALFRWLIPLEQPDGVARNRARRELRSMLKNVTAERWRTELQNDDSLRTLALEFQKLEGRSAALGHALFTALDGYVPELAQTDIAFSQRWFTTAELLSADGRRTLLRNMRDRLLNIEDANERLILLRRGGDLLMKEAGFAATADRSVRHVLIPLLPLDDGLAWICERPEAFVEWVRKCTSSTRNFLAEQLLDMANGAPDDRRDQLLGLSNLWSLGLPSADTAKG